MIRKEFSSNILAASFRYSFSEAVIHKNGEVMGQFSSFWEGPTLGFLERACLSSFLSQGHQIELYGFRKPQGLPHGVHWKKAEEIVPETELFENPSQPGSFAGFSNIFRYRLLQRIETTWIDLDVMSHNWPPNEDHAQLLGFENTQGTVNGAVLRLPRDDELLYELDRIASMTDTKRLRWGQLGPNLITQEVVRLGRLEVVMPQSVFYEIEALETWRLFDPSQAEYVDRRLQDSWAVHLWNKVLLQTGPELRKFSAPIGSWFHRQTSGMDALHHFQPLPAEWSKRLMTRQQRYGSPLSRVIRLGRGKLPAWSAPPRTS